MKNKKLKIGVVGNSFHYANPYLPIAKITSIEKADIILFTGGADVDPSLYGHVRDKKTYSNIERDLQETVIFNKYPNKMKLGICRGSQLLTVLNGGVLVQDLNNHAISGTHTIEFENKVKLGITSTHHQMSYPYNLSEENYRLIAWASPRRAAFYKIADRRVDSIGLEPEIIWYPKTSSLGIQGHPEMMNIESITVKYIRNLILKLWQEHNLRPF